MAENFKTLSAPIMADPARAACVAEHQVAIRESLVAPDAELAVGHTCPTADVVTEFDAEDVAGQSR